MTKRWGLVASVVNAMVMGSDVLLGSETVCGREPLGSRVNVVFHTDPMRDEPEISKQQFLAVLPKGNPLSKMRDILGESAYEGYCKEASNDLSSNVVDVPNVTVSTFLPKDLLA